MISTAIRMIVSYPVDLNVFWNHMWLNRRKFSGFLVWNFDSRFRVPEVDKESQILSAIFCYVELGNSEGTSWGPSKTIFPSSHWLINYCNKNVETLNHEYSILRKTPNDIFMWRCWIKMTDHGPWFMSGQLNWSPWTISVQEIICQWEWPQTH